MTSNRSLSRPRLQALGRLFLLVDELVVQMELVPPYLAAYLWQIRKHSGELGYVKRRLEQQDVEQAVYEKSMLTELVELHLIALSDEDQEIVFNPREVKIAPGVVAIVDSDESTMTVSGSFVLLARGHYLWTEYVFAGGRWLLTAFLGALIALLVSA